MVQIMTEWASFEVIVSYLDFWINMYVAMWLDLRKASFYYKYLEKQF